MKAWMERVDTEKLKRNAKAFEEGWQAVCEFRGEHRYIEVFDEQRLCYGRLCLPSEALFVWNNPMGPGTGEWLPSNENDQYGRWKSVRSERPS